MTTLPQLDDIFLADVEIGLATIPNNSISLIFTSPPYNVSIKYGDHNDCMPYTKYLDWLKRICEQCYRILRPGGRLIINIDAIHNEEEDSIAESVDDVKKQRFRPIIADLQNICFDIGLNWRCDICWDKHQVSGNNSACWGSWQSPSCPNIRRRHEYLLIWSKGPWKMEPTVPGTKSDEWAKNEFESCTMSYWPIKPQTKKLGGHPVGFPEELAYRAIKLFSFAGDTVLDPFCGTGTTCVVAHKMKRRYIGIDNDEKFVEYAKNRIDKSTDMFDEE